MHSTQGCDRRIYQEGRLSKYTKDGKRSREESPKKGHSPKKEIYVATEGESKDVVREKGEGHKGKCSYITSIIEGGPRLRVSSKGTIKRKIVELMVVCKKEGNNLATNLGRPIPEFQDI